MVAPPQLAQMTAHKAHLDRKLGLEQNDYYHHGGLEATEAGRRGNGNGSDISNYEKPRVEIRE